MNNNLKLKHIRNNDCHLKTTKKHLKTTNSFNYFCPFSKDLGPHFRAKLAHLGANLAIKDLS